MDTKIINALIKARSYRAFLNDYFRIQKQQNSNFSYASFAKLAGFSSKSYARDIIIGKKRITAKALPAFSKALKLKGLNRKLFELLVKLEENDLNTNKLTDKQIKTSIKEITQKLQEKINPSFDKNDWRLFLNKDFPALYAALGTKEEGTSIDDISKKTAFNLEKCKLNLKKLMDCKVVEFNPNENKYYPKDMHLIFENLGKNEFFKAHFLNSLEIAKKQINNSFSSEHKLFLNSTFSIQKSKLPQLKKELRQLLTDYVDLKENPNGDSIVTLTTAFFPLNNN